MMSLAKALTAACLLLCGSVTAFELKGHYEEDGVNVYYDVARAIELKCTANEAADIQWYKNDTKVEDVKALKDRYAISTSDGRKESNFKIARSVQGDAGEYSCRAKGKQQSFQVAGNVLVKLQANVALAEGETLRLHCNAVGTGVVINWILPDNSSIDDNGYHEDDRVRVETEGEAQNDVLIMEAVTKKERGTFVCRGHQREINRDTEAISESYVRVKDKLAALWPFIGICSEVFILCAIILIYEKRRVKIPDDDSDTDQNPEQKNDHNVRHRK